MAGINIGSNTNAQIKNRANGTIVDQTDGYYPNENNLLPGDCLYFKGNSGHALDVGHVEMYIGNGKCAGHGSGTGPTIKDVRAYWRQPASKSRRYFMAIRWIGGGEGSGAEIAGTLGERLLKRGCAGIDVRELQAQLIALATRCLHTAPMASMARRQKRRSRPSSATTSWKPTASMAR